MKIRTIYAILLLLMTTSLYNCASSNPAKTPSTVEEAQKLQAKKQKKQARAAKKEQKAAYKRYWNAQSKEARKSIKKNKRAQKRIAKHRKKDHMN